jgi:hypothetical protein
VLAGGLIGATQGGMVKIAENQARKSRKRRRITKKVMESARKRRKRSNGNVSNFGS